MRKVNVRLWIAAATAALFAGPLVAGAAAAQGVSGARTFVVGIYSHYPTPDGETPFDWQQRQLYDAGLAALIAEDIRQANGEEPAWMDSDVFCQCQDPGGVRWSVLSVAATGAATATARIALTFGPDHSVLTIILARTADGWRVHDITGAHGSWRRNLANAVRHPQDN
jgi:hypothetical protein